MVAAKNRTHGGAGDANRLYRIWKNMKTRCHNPTGPDFKNYGGRGIGIASEWGDFEVFRDWALANGYRDDLTIERIEVNGDYEPSNCTFVPNEQQVLNRRITKVLAAFGETKLLVEWVEDPRCAVSRDTLYRRIQRGWADEAAITTPSGAQPAGTASS